MTAFDCKAFGAAVKARLRAGDLTTTMGAAAAGVSRAQLHRAANAQAVNVGAFLTLCRWLAVDPFAFPCDPNSFTKTITETRSPAEEGGRDAG